MNDLDAFTHSVRAWGARKGIDLIADASGHFDFAIDEIAVRVSGESQGQSTLIGAVLLDQDLGHSALAMRALLAFGHLGVTSRRCGVSMSDQGRPVLWFWIEWAPLDETALTNTLDGFLEVALAGRGFLVEAMRSGPSDDRADFAGLPPGLVKA